MTLPPDGEWISCATAASSACATPDAPREVILKFGHDSGWSPSLGSNHRMRLTARLHDRNDEWQEPAEFDWRAPPPGAEIDRYITYRNAPPEDL